MAKPGDVVAVRRIGLAHRHLRGRGDQVAAPRRGAANPYCANHKPQPVDTTENAQSVGSVITYGKFRVVHLGDLTWNKEFELMCPMNRIGTVDLFIVSHHGQPSSNAEVLVHAIRARAAIMNNGTRKGGQPDAMKIIHSAPGMEDLWQMHFSLLSGQEYTVPGLFIANLLDEQPAAMPVTPMTPPQPGPATPPPPAHNGPAHWFKVSAQADGSFTVTNTRNGFSKTYAAARLDAQKTPADHHRHRSLGFRRRELSHRSRRRARRRHEVLLADRAQAGLDVTGTRARRSCTG